MINANELRIGNWLLGCNNYYFQVDTDTFVALEHKSSNYNSDCPAPIPLTPEILEKCGFEFEKSGYNDFDIYGTWVIDNFEITQFIDNGFGISLLDGEYVDLSFVHELQNIYFITKQTELQITL